MPLADIRRILIDCLVHGRYQNEIRRDLEAKNWLATRTVTPAEVVEMLHACRDRQHRLSPHDIVPRIMVHEFTPYFQNDRWYVKAYLLAERAVFISVHPTES